jgi:hypothetical protein
VWIPKIYNGRNRLFFSSNWEGFKNRLQNTGNFTVIPDAWRNGDFSKFPTTLYDPQTRVQTGNTYTAQPFPNNTIMPSRLDRHR